MVIERMLGGEVVAFSDPREALHYMSAITPTLLVLDHRMADLDGIQVVKVVRNSPNTRSVPVIMLTAALDPDLKTRAIGAGVNAFLNKPIGAEEFAQYVKRLSAASRVRMPAKDEETIELRVRADDADKRLRERDRAALAAIFRAFEARDPDGAKKMRLAAEIGVLLCALTLVTGSIWGHSTWGVWWTWDARLTAEALLLVLYLGYLALRRVPAEEEVRGRRSAIAALVAALDIPVDHFATSWWRTLHQGSTISLTKPDAHLDAAHGVGLLLGFVAVFLVYGWLLAHRYRLEQLESRYETEGLAAALEERRAEGGSAYDAPAPATQAREVRP